MYVCVCNAIKECEFRGMARQTDGDAHCVYAMLGKQPNCGHCLDEAEAVLDEEREQIVAALGLPASSRGKSDLPGLPAFS